MKRNFPVSRERSGGGMRRQRVLLDQDEVKTKPFVKSYDISATTPIQASEPRSFSVHGPVARRWRDRLRIDTRR
jgi:hypothetical protein